MGSTKKRDVGPFGEGKGRQSEEAKFQRHDNRVIIRLCEHLQDKLPVQRHQVGTMPQGLCGLGTLEQVGGEAAKGLHLFSIAATEWQG